MIYTSYFAMMRNFPEEGVLPISISRFPPKWYTGICVKNLAPPEDLLLKYKSNPDMPLNEYERRYQTEILDHHVTENWIKKGVEMLSPETLDKKPIWESETDHAIFLCFEKPNEFCHRHLLSKHLETLKIPCKEASKEDFEQWKIKRNLFKEIEQSEVDYDK